MTRSATPFDMLEICAEEFRRLSKEAALQCQGPLSLVEKEQAERRMARYDILAQHCESFCSQAEQTA